jgi:NTP pyrophosphatase (non-canonical NTP hydrolase)
MNLIDIIKTQRQFDEEHGFNIKNQDIQEKYNQISKELIGLVGEIGEFANLVKKINLSLDSHLEDDEAHITGREAQMREELVDVFIYLIRLCDLLNVDIEKGYCAKLDANKLKYSGFKK